MICLADDSRFVRQRCVRLAFVLDDVSKHTAHYFELSLRSRISQMFSKVDLDAATSNPRTYWYEVDQYLSLTY
jgi:hypothetical protein